MYSIVEKGTPNTLDYRIFYTKDDKPISPFHDIPLYTDDSKNYCNMIVEIPRWTNAKMEICKEEPLNPIKQDVKKGKLRFVNNVFPYHGYIWNYGALPQTWEDPNHVDSGTGCAGDDDPLDAVEIGSAVATRGEVKQVKILGVIAMIDEGETDWKLVCIDRNDPMADSLSDIGDVEAKMPGILEATRDWFRIYKVPTGKPMNDFAYKGEWKNRDFANNVINETHEYWNALMSGQGTKIDCTNTTVTTSKSKISVDEASGVLGSQPEKNGDGPPVAASTQDHCFVSRTVPEKVCH